MSGDRLVRRADRHPGSTRSATAVVPSGRVFPVERGPSWVGRPRMLSVRCQICGTCRFRCDGWRHPHVPWWKSDASRQQRDETDAMRDRSVRSPTIRVSLRQVRPDGRFVPCTKRDPRPARLVRSTGRPAARRSPGSTGRTAVIHRLVPSCGDSMLTTASPSTRRLDSCPPSGTDHGLVDALEIGQIGELDDQLAGAGPARDRHPGVEMVGQELLELQEAGLRERFRCPG